MQLFCILLANPTQNVLSNLQNHLSFKIDFVMKRISLIPVFSHLFLGWNFEGLLEELSKTQEKKFVG